MSNSTRDNDNEPAQQRPDRSGHESGAAAALGMMATRRGLLRASLKASPVVLTLASRPVLAWHCKTPSSHASANLSHHAQQNWADSCTATAQAWLNKCNGSSALDACGASLSLPSGVTKTTQCNTLMGSGTTSSIKTILTSGTGVQKTLIAAMLNVLTGRVPGQCVVAQHIKDMWSCSGAGSAYHPSPGIDWYKQDIVNYLHNNWIATVSIFGGSPPPA